MGDQVWQAADVVLVSVGDDQEIELNRCRIRRKQGRQLGGNRRVARATDLIAGMRTVDEHRAAGNLKQTAVSVFLFTNVEKMKARRGWSIGRLPRRRRA